MNGQCAMQQEDQGQWRNAKVKKARGVKPGIYNIYTANKADKSKEHSGVILYIGLAGAFEQKLTVSTKSCHENFSKATTGSSV